MATKQATPFKYLGLHLQACRLDSGLTQQALADAVGVHVQFVSNWERGLCGPPTHCKKKMKKVLSLTYTELSNVIDADFVEASNLEMRKHWGFKA